jgi:hypothetical protein
VIVYPQQAFEKVREALNEERYPIVKVTEESLHDTIHHVTHAAQTGVPLAFDLSHGLPPALRTHLANMAEGQLAAHAPGDSERTIVSGFRQGFAIVCVVEERQEDDAMLQSLASSFCRIAPEEN